MFRLWTNEQLYTAKILVAVSVNEITECDEDK